MTISVRVDAKTEGMVERLAKQRRQTKSAVIREAIHYLAKISKGNSSSSSVYDKVKHLIGCVEINDRTLSENTGDRFFKILREKTRERRSG